MAGKPSGKGPRGVRLNPAQTARCRNAIATSQIINRLNTFILGGKDQAELMTPAQVSAALGLLRKTLPDLSQVDGDMTLTMTKHEDALSELEDAAMAKAQEGHGYAH